MRRVVSRSWRSAALALGLLTQVVSAQTAPAHDWVAELTDKRLYLRGFWGSDQLHFDAAGRPLGDVRGGPVTLSGFKADRVVIRGKHMTLDGSRMALVLDGERGAQAKGIILRPIISTTYVPFTMRPETRHFKTAEAIHIVVDMDEDGSFDRPIAAVFAQSLVQLAPDVPVYWRCFAQSFFMDQVKPGANAAVDRCAASSEGTEDSGVVPAKMLITPFPTMPGSLIALVHVSEIIIHVRISAEGLPLEMQIVRAAGAGAEESALLAISKWTFTPATRSGVPVMSHLDLSFLVAPPGFHPEPQP